ncbi:sigma 54-interacting transcriptional regulator [Acidobacteriota bacterium]
MFEVIKEKTWNLLKEKEISLAMIYDKEGNILWHKGRAIRGKDVFDGSGFCKSYIEESLKNPVRIDIEDYIESVPQNLSSSAKEMLVKSIIIHPLHNRYYLYVDSGKKEIFTKEDRTSFRILGELLEQVMTTIREAEVYGISGRSETVEEIRNLVVKYSLEEEPVLLSGATGVGKNHIADLIHRYSGRKGKFVIVDTPNIDQHLFESKLFGHKKGAFTDARFDKTGLVEEAERGTLFFDEVTEVPLEIQAKLLRFIDTKKFYTLGESTEKLADVRIIAATNKNLQTAVAEKEFRQDLLYRLNVLEINIPPLHERKEDIKNLVLENQVLLRGKEIGDGFWDVVNDYPWTGNVRELLNMLKRAGIMLEGPITGEKLLSLFNVDSEIDTPDREDTEALIKEIRGKVKAGENFWTLIWKPFIGRDIDRKTVKTILKTFYTENSSNFKKMIGSLNVKVEDYQKFMSLLYKYKIDPRK